MSSSGLDQDSQSNNLYFGAQNSDSDAPQGSETNQVNERDMSDDANFGEDILGEEEEEGDDLEEDDYMDEEFDSDCNDEEGWG